jgi:hypothetical protein
MLSVSVSGHHVFKWLAVSRNIGFSQGTIWEHSPGSQLLLPFLGLHQSPHLSSRAVLSVFAMRCFPSFRSVPSS